MPYRKIGFTIVPRSEYIPQYCTDILKAFSTKFDLINAEVVKSLGRENIMLKNFSMERLLTFKHAVFDGSDELKLKYIIVMADYLHSIGYITDSPVLVDYVTDPVLPADKLLTWMMGARMPKFTASELGGDWGTIDHLMMFFSEVIRRNALILEERLNLARRFREWLGSIGYKLLTHDGELSQAERSFLCVYSSCLPNFKGFISILGAANLPIPAVATKDPLVLEVGALAVATALPGPCFSHMKLISNGILEQLFYYYGPHVAELKMGVGHFREYGPFRVYSMTPSDAISWQAESQLVGLSSNAANFLVQPSGVPPFSLRSPFPRVVSDQMGTLCLYPDDPSFKLVLTDPTDISHFDFSFMSKWRGRWISSTLDGGSMDYALADAAVNNKAFGNTQVDMADLLTVGLCHFTPAASTKINDIEDGVFEEYILPGPNGLTKMDIDMTAYYARFGTVEMLPAFSEFLELPQAWFMQPAERVLDYIASVRGLTIEQRIRFARVIEICHNCARYLRLTKAVELPFDRDRLVQAMMNDKATTIPKLNI